jgi:hypothetical protein
MSQTLLNYQQVLEQLQASANKIADVTELLENQSELVLDHNEDTNAHAYIQQRINEISTLNPITVSTAINGHDSSATSHADLRARLVSVEQVVNNVSGGSIANAITTNINNHNQSSTAHADIRALISNMASSSTITNTINDAISAHNTSNTAHPTLTNQITSLSNTVSSQSTELQSIRTTVSVIEATINSGGTNGTIPMSSFTHGFPAIVKPGDTYTLSFGGVPTPPTGSIVFSIDAGSSGLTFSKTSDIAPGENITATVPVGATRGSIKTFTVTAAYTATSDTGVRAIAFSVNRLPDVSNVALSLSDIVKPNTTNSVSITNSSDPDGQPVTFTISCDKSYVSFSKSSELTVGESFDIIYSSAATRGETPTFTIVASDGLETASKTITTGKVNTLPNASTITANGLQTSVVGGTSYTFTLTGGTDSDNQTLEYTITGGSGLNITPTTNIASGANVTFNPTKVATATNITFTVYAVDSLGEQSATGKDFTVTVNPIMQVATPSIISPTPGSEITLPYTFQVSPYSENPEL